MESESSLEQLLKVVESNLNESLSVGLSRGVESPLIVPQLEKTVKLHFRDLIFFLSKTKDKKSVMNKIKMKLGNENIFVVDPLGKASGLVVMWRKGLNVYKVLFTDFTIELLTED